MRADEAEMLLDEIHKALIAVKDLEPPNASKAVCMLADSITALSKTILALAQKEYHGGVTQ